MSPVLLSQHTTRETWYRLQPVEFSEPPRPCRDPRLPRDQRTWRPEMPTMIPANIPSLLPWRLGEDTSDARSRSETGPGGLICKIQQDRILYQAQLLHSPRTTDRDWSTGYCTPTPALLHVTPIGEKETQADRVKQRLDDLRRGFLVQDPEVDSPGIIDIEARSNEPASPLANSLMSPKEAESAGSWIAPVSNREPQSRTGSGSNTPSGLSCSTCSTCCRSCCSQMSSPQSSIHSQTSPGKESTQLATPTSVTESRLQIVEPDREANSPEALENDEPEQQPEQNVALIAGQAVADPAAQATEPVMWRPW